MDPVFRFAVFAPAPQLPCLRPGLGPRLGPPLTAPRPYGPPLLGLAFYIIQTMSRSGPLRAARAVADDLTLTPVETLRGFR